MKKYLFTFLCLLLAMPVYAAAGPLEEAGKAGGFNTSTNQNIIASAGKILTVLLGFLGTITFLIFLYGGFLWLTAGGNDEQVAKAKSYIFNGVIGTVIIMAAYSISYFVTSAFKP